MKLFYPFCSNSKCTKMHVQNVAQLGESDLTQKVVVFFCVWLEKKSLGYLWRTNNSNLL